MKIRILFAALAMLMGFTAQVQAISKEIITELSEPENAKELCRTSIYPFKKFLRQKEGVLCKDIKGAILFIEVCKPYYKNNGTNDFQTSQCGKNVVEKWFDTNKIGPRIRYFRS